MAKLGVPAVLPSVAGWELRTRLRRARTDAAWSRAEVASALDWSVSKLLRIENGDVGVSTTDLMGLARFYSLSDTETDELIELARASRRPSIASEFGDVLTKEFESWLDFELAASEIRHYESKLIPGILQNHGYATSIVSAYNRGEAESIIVRKIMARQLRAEYLLRPQGPKMWFIIDEAVLRRGVGNELTNTPDFSVMLRVIANLRRLNTVGRAANNEKIDEALNPNVSIQIMPLEYGAYSALRGPFEILEFADPNRDYMLYQETATGDFVNQNTGRTITPYLEDFEEVQGLAHPASETNALIDQIEETIRSGTNGIPIRKTHQ